MRESGVSMELNEPSRAWLERLRLSLGGSNSPVSDQEILQGCHLGTYRFGHLLGLGGGGAVFAGHASENPDLQLAIKVISRIPGEGDDDTMFRREVEIGRRLRHPGLVRIFDTHESESARFVVMERVDGQNLTQLLGKPWPTEQCLSIFEKLVEGLQYAHDQGVVHRDLKPENVRITSQGVVKILDFGLAQVKGSAELTKSGQFKGTPMHTSPEQIKSSKDVTPACDQFALGLMLFEAISGGFPYDVDPEQPVLALFARMEKPAKPLRLLSPEQSPELEAVLTRMLAMEPEDRYPSVSEAFRALKRQMLEEQGQG